MKIMRARTDYTKIKTGKLTGVKVIGKTDCENQYLIWEMVCDCGQKVIKTASQIRSGKLLSCMDCKVHSLKRPRNSKFFNGQKRPYIKRS